MVSEVIHGSLREALDAARDMAQEEPLVKSEQGGGAERPGRRGEEPRRPWFYVPDAVFMARARVLLRTHGLEFDWLGTTLNERGVETTWRLRLRATGESEIYRYQAPIMTGLETMAHGVVGTTHQARRTALELLLDIPQVDQAPQGDRVVGGVIVGPPARPTPTPPEQARELAAMGPLPDWPEPAPVFLTLPERADVAGLDDPGQLGGDAEGDAKQAEGLFARVARTEGELVDAEALRAALRSRGRRLGLPPAEWLTSALRAAHPGVEGVDWSKAFNPNSADYKAQRVTLITFLQDTGDLP